MDLVIAASLIGILLAISVPSIRRALAREEIDGWTRSITFDLAAARQAAQTRRASVTVTLTLPRTYAIVAGGTTLRRDTLPGDISMATTFAGGTFSFDRRGVPSAAGTITLTSALTGRSYTITIADGTGRVSYSEN